MKKASSRDHVGSNGGSCRKPLTMLGIRADEADAYNALTTRTQFASLSHEYDSDVDSTRIRKPVHSIHRKLSVSEDIESFQDTYIFSGDNQAKTHHTSLFGRGGRGAHIASRNCTYQEYVAFISGGGAEGTMPTFSRFPTANDRPHAFHCVADANPLMGAGAPPLRPEPCVTAAPLRRGLEGFVSFFVKTAMADDTTPVVKPKDPIVLKKVEDATKPKPTDETKKDAATAAAPATAKKTDAPAKTKESKETKAKESSKNESNEKKKQPSTALTVTTPPLSGRTDPYEEPRGHFGIRRFFRRVLHRPRRQAPAAEEPQVIEKPILPIEGLPPSGPGSEPTITVITEEDIKKMEDTPKRPSASSSSSPPHASASVGSSNSIDAQEEAPRRSWRSRLNPLRLVWGHRTHKGDHAAEEAAAPDDGIEEALRQAEAEREEEERRLREEEEERAEAEAEEARRTAEAEATQPMPPPEEPEDDKNKKKTSRKPRDTEMSLANDLNPRNGFIFSNDVDPSYNPFF